MKTIPVPETQELQGREAYEVLVEHFGFEDARTAPMPLEELPALPTLQETELDRFLATLGPRRRAR